MDVYFGIASYHRADNQRTIAYLEQLGIDKKSIYLSLQCEEDVRAYKAAGIEERIGGLLYQRGRNVSDNRNTILNGLPRGAKIVMLDDDINAICRLAGGKLKRISSAEELYAMIRTGYALAAKHRTVGFVLYPVNNAFYMSKGHTPRNVVIGTCIGIINTDLRFDPDCATKEDYEFCCQAIRRYGSFVRLNYFSCEAQHYTAGGCEDAWKDKEGMQKTARRLVGKYPDILELNRKRPGEVKMVKIKRGGSRQ